MTLWLLGFLAGVGLAVRVWLALRTPKTTAVTGWSVREAERQRIRDLLR